VAVATDAAWRVWWQPLKIVSHALMHAKIRRESENSECDGSAAQHEATHVLHRLSRAIEGYLINNHRPDAKWLVPRMRRP